MTDEANTADDAEEGSGAEDGAAPGSLPGDDLTEAQLEALLFVAERPLGRRELATFTGASPGTIDARLGDLEVALAGRGIRLLVDGDRVALATAPDAGLLIGRYVGREPTRLSPATLETLAIVAYRQPVTKAGIERIRGVDAEYAIRSLLHRRLVVELGRAEAPGRPFLYGTSVDFLERFGLVSLDELPLLDATIAERLVAPDAPGGAAAADAVPGPDEEADDEPGDSGPRVMAAERLGKVLAAAGVASRRGADALVEAGRVTVDGRPAVLGEKVDLALQVVAVDGRPIGTAAVTPVHLAIHKPAGVTSTAADRHAARTVIDLVPPSSWRAARGSIPSAGWTRTPRGCSCSPTTGRGPSGCSIRATAWSASTPWPSRAPSTAGSGRRSRPGSSWRRGSPAWSRCGPPPAPRRRSSRPRWTRRPAVA